MRALVGRFVAMTLVGVSLAGCGPGLPRSSAAPSATPPEVTAGPTDRGPGLPDCPNYVEVVATGPTFGGEDQGEFGPLAQEQRRLEADIAAAQAYGAEHLDEFASIRFENGPRVRIVVGFTDHVAEHCVALRELLTFKDEFEIIRQRASESELEAAQAEILAVHRDQLQSIGRGAGVLHVSFRADGEAAAADVLAAYGELVEITVGMLSFPDRQLPPRRGCGLPADRILDDAPFRATLVLEPGPVRSGADFEGTVRVTNVGLTTMTFESGQPMTAWVLRPGDDEVVGGYTGAIAGTGAGDELDPLETFDIRVLGGTASCDPALGYALPPGDYEVRTLVDQYVMPDAAPTEVFYLLSDAAPLTIVP